jgi:hypothetical protein
MTEEQKALKACADYSRFSGEITRLSAALSESLSKCSGVRTPELGDSTHLSVAYRPEVVESDEHYGDVHNVFMTDVEIRAYLAICPHCLAAHDTIQARKAARRSLGAAKRQISVIGRKAAT